MTTTIERDGVEIEIEVEYDFEKPCRGSRGPYGEQMEPDTGPSAEIIRAVNVETGEEIELTPEEDARIVEKIIEEESERAYEDRYADPD